MEKRVKRILFICKGHPNIAGAQLYLKQIVSLFCKEGYELHFALHKGDGLRVFDEIGRDCRVYLWEYDWRHLSRFRSFLWGIKLFQKIRPDAVIFNSSEDRVFPPIWAAWVYRIKNRVMVVHWAETPGSLHLFRKKVGLPMPLPSRYAIKRRVLKGVSLRLLKKIIFVNAITRTAYIELYRVPSGRCVTIYNGIQPEYFRDLEITREGVRGALGVKSGEYMVLAAGNLAEVKGYKYLISAIYDLVEKGIPIKCFIAGQGELKEELEKQIMSLELDRNVKLLGYRDDIPSLLTAADIFCMPSLNEALGYSLLEAMAAGIPVIASNVGGIPEALTDGKEGLLVPSGDVRELSLAIQKLISDDELAKRLGLNGRHTVNQTFSLERMLTQTRDFLLNDLQI